MLPNADENDASLRDVTRGGQGFLYRYRDLTGSGLERAQRIVTESELHFSSPADFNDPFDCQARFRDDMPVAEFNERADALMAARGLSREARRDALRNPKSVREFAKNVAAGLQGEIDRTGVLCLSATHENILMWAHYSFGHRGICLQFQVTDHVNFLGASQPVKYSESLPIPTLFGNNDHDRVDDILLTKSIDWAYEKEWRVIDTDRPPGVRKFPPELLTAVILGANTSKSDRDEVLRWLEHDARQINIYQAERDRKRFGLKFVQLE